VTTMRRPPEDGGLRGRMARPKPRGDDIADRDEPGDHAPR